MSVESQLIELISKLQTTQESALSRMDEKIDKISNYTHEIKNDYHNVAQLSKAANDRVKEISNSLTHRIDSVDKKLEEIERDLNDMRPSVATLKKISDNVLKIVSGLVVGALIWVVVKMQGG